MKELRNGGGFMALVETVRSILKTKGSQVWSLPPEATVYDALAVMAEKQVGALLVISQGKPVGVVSERDYARKVFLRGRSSMDTRLDEIMGSPVITVTPDHTVDECMRIMTHHRIRHLPVMDGEQLAGVVSIGDLVNSIISSQQATIEQLHSYIAGNYPV
jgi:CBS domain-containing protein